MNYKLKKIALFFGTVVAISLTTGCGSTDNYVEESYEISDKASNEVAEDNKISNVEENKIFNEGSKTESTQYNIEKTKDSQIIEYFKNLKEKVSDNLTTENLKKYGNKAKENVKNAFITTVDFIFYDKEIKGIKFDDLKEQTKNDVLKCASAMDKIIVKKFPNYKEEISEKFGKTKEKASEIYEAGTEKIKEKVEGKLGEEKYDNLTSKIDKAKEKYGEVKEEVKDKASNAKQKVKNWYEGLR